jgi:hypothetical protein
MPRLTSSALLGASSSCSCRVLSGTPQLMNLRNTRKGRTSSPCCRPRRWKYRRVMAALPEPTPGARNRVDPDPEGDAIAALGGNPARAAGAGSDLVSYSTRFGVSGDIRPVLAAEDEEFRRRNDGRVLERMFGTNVYFEAYRRQALDRYAELERLRRMGVRTPAAPPSNQ